MWWADPSPRSMGVVAVLAVLAALISAGATGPERTVRGQAAKMGAGTVQSFVTLDPSGAPSAIGVTLSPGALEQLPPMPNTVSRCFDLDGNGRHTGHECIGDEERILDIPAGSSNGLPFRWMSVNWNPAGHHNTPTPGPTSTFTSIPGIGTGSRPSRRGAVASWRTAATSRLPPVRFRLSICPAATSTWAPWSRGWGTTCSIPGPPSSRIPFRSPARSSTGPTTAS